MKYYKNENNELFINPIVKNHIGLIEISKEEFYAQLELNNTPTDEELAAQTLNNKKNLGIDYTNMLGDIYKVSLTSEDANGLIQVKTAFEFGITETNFECSNGTIVPIKSMEDLLHLGEFVVTERNKFFI